MAIQWNCPRCHKPLSIASRKAGTQIHCPTCCEPLTVPGESNAVAPLPEAASGSERQFHGIAIGLSLLVLATGGLLLYVMVPTAEDEKLAEANPPPQAGAVARAPVPVAPGAGDPGSGSSANPGTGCRRPFGPSHSLEKGSAGCGPPRAQDR